MVVVELDVIVAVDSGAADVFGLQDEESSVRETMAEGLVGVAVMAMLADDVVLVVEVAAGVRTLLEVVLEEAAEAVGWGLEEDPFHRAGPGMM